MSRRTFIRILVASVALLLCARPAAAADQFKLVLETFKHYDSCGEAKLIYEGVPDLFAANDLPIPAYTESGAFRQYANGAQFNRFNGPFSGTLLRVGTNDFDFHIHVSNGGDGCSHYDHEGMLQGPNIATKPLISVKVRNTGYDGSTQVSLGLREIDPVLADDLDYLKGLIAGRKATLQAQGPLADGALAESARLDQLIHDVDALLALGFDGITEAMLKALLDQYADMLTPELRNALTQLVHDLKANIDELRAEIDRIAGGFQERLDAVTSVLDEAPGFDPENPGSFEPIGDTDGVPPVEVPDILGTDPFDPTHDPYADYADEVIAQLEAFIGADGQVADRLSFLLVVDAWRTNIAALEQALILREAVSAREYGAFLIAKGRVTTRLSEFLDRQFWFNDTRVPPELRDWMDLGVAARSFMQAKRLKLTMNSWVGELTERQIAILDFLWLLDATSEYVWREPPAENDSEDGIFDGLLGGVIEFAVLTAVEFSPLGDVKDACELVTGWENCNPNGRTLTLKERALSGAGLLIGSGAMWRRAGDLVQGAAGCTLSGLSVRAGIPCKLAKRAANALSEALEEVRRFKPSRSNPNIADVRDLPGGRTLYIHVDGYQVIYSKRGFPDFSNYLRPMFDGKKNDVLIDLAAPPNRIQDFRRANIEAGFGDTPNPPDGYTWHHHEDLGRMQLVKSEVHNVAEGGFPHTGSVAYWKKIYELTQDD